MFKILENHLLASTTLEATFSLVLVLFYLLNALPLTIFMRHFRFMLDDCFMQDIYMLILCVNYQELMYVLGIINKILLCKVVFQMIIFCLT